MACCSSRDGRAGRPALFSDTTNKFRLSIKVLFKLPLRAAAVNTVLPAPFPDGLLGDAVALRHLPGRLRARLDGGPDLRRRRRLLVKRDQHDRPGPDRYIVNVE